MGKIVKPIWINTSGNSKSCIIFSYHQVFAVRENVKSLSLQWNIMKIKKNMKRFDSKSTMSQSPVGVPHRHPIHIDRRITWPRVTTVWTNLVLPRWPLCYCHLCNLMMYLQYFRQNTNMNKRKISQSFILFIRFNLNLHFFKFSKFLTYLSMQNHLSPSPNLTHKTYKAAILVSPTCTYSGDTLCKGC